MIISGKSIQNVLKVYGDQIQGVNKTKKGQNEITQGKDEFILSTGAQEFSHVFNAIRGISDVRPDKVKEFSDQLAADTYETDSQAIAEKMLGIYTGR